MQPEVGVKARIEPKGSFFQGGPTSTRSRQFCIDSFLLSKVLSKNIAQYDGQLRSNSVLNTAYS